MTMSMVVKLFALLVALLASTQVLDAVTPKGYSVLIHHATGKVAAFNGTLVDWGQGEKWKQWIVYSYTGNKHVFKIGPEGNPDRNPSPQQTTVMKIPKCSASQIGSDKYTGNAYDLWIVNDGVGEIFSRCTPKKLQVIVRAGQLFAEKEEVVREGDKKNLFEVITVKEFQKRMKQ